MSKKLCSLIIWGLVIILLVIFGIYLDKVDKKAASQKEKIYRYNVDELDYSMFKTKSYNVKYYAETEYGQLPGEEVFTFYEDGSCKHNDTGESENLRKIINSKKCSYTTDENTVTINETANIIYEPLGVYKRLGAQKIDEIETNVITGKFEDKYLKMDDWKYLDLDKFYHRGWYTSVKWETYVDKKIDEVLINPKTTKDYTITGIAIDDSNDTINVNNYYIIDKTKD